VIDFPRRGEARGTKMVSADLVQWKPERSEIHQMRENMQSVEFSWKYIVWTGIAERFY
jgi:hypothetical protein